MQHGLLENNFSQMTYIIQKTGKWVIKFLKLHIYISIISLSAYGVNDSVKRHRVPDRIRQQNPYKCWGFSSGAVVKNPPANAGNVRDVA